MSAEGDLGDDNEILVPSTIQNPGGGASSDQEALVDTGGKFSLISAGLADTLELEKKRDVDLITARGKTEAPVYYVRVEIDGLIDDIVNVVESTAEGHLFVLGRPVLKEWEIEYLGPSGSWVIERP